MALLRDFYLTFLAAFTGRFALGTGSPEARAVLGIAPTAAAKLSVSRIAAALRRAGLSRNIDPTAAELKAALRTPQLRQPLSVDTAMGHQPLALLAGSNTACVSVADLGQAAAEAFQAASRLRRHHQLPRSCRLHRRPEARRDRR